MRMIVEAGGESAQVVFPTNERRKLLVILSQGLPCESIYRGLAQVGWVPVEGEQLDMFLPDTGKSFVHRSAGTTAKQNAMRIVQNRVVHAILDKAA